MMHEKMRKGNRGVVLIVVVGVLAVLSLLAATFGMIARLELAASRNQTEYEMAREAAHAGAESLSTALQTLGPMTSGALPTFLPNSSDTDGMLLYRRDGVKVYFAVNDTVPAGSVTPDWLQGLGLQDAGMFNINAMGFDNDLGSNTNPNIRYTSFDCSLVRLLASRFATVSANDISNVNNTGIDNIRGAGYPSFANPNEQQRVAILLARAIINWRHGLDGFPGTRGTEERRLGHLPRWSSTLGWTQQDTGISPNPNLSGVVFPASNPAWGTADGFPSRFIMTCLPGLNAPDLLMNWTYTEPELWTSYTYSGAAGNWNNDIGLPTPGLFWGTMAPGCGAMAVTADSAQPGWRDWPTNTWSGYAIYVATGPCKWVTATIASNNATTLTLVAPGLGAVAPTPAGGDAFCICPPPPPQQTPIAAFAPGQYVGLLSKRWVNTDTYVEGDLVPNAMLWPDGTLATEGNVVDLVLDSGIVSDAENNYLVPGTTIMQDTDAVVTKTWTTTFPQGDPSKTLIGKVVHIYGGIGRGQVRTITSYTDTQLTLSTPWTAGNIPMTPWTTAPPAPWTTSYPCQYRIELLDDNLPSKFQPNNLQGDDRLYLSLGDLYSSVIVPTLGQGPTNDGLPPDGLTTAQAQAVAGILLPYFQPYLSVSTQAIQASQSLCSINDWAVDGMDNDANGVVDDPANEAQYEQSSPQVGNTNRASLANTLYHKLGLYTWAHTGAAAATTTRVEQAAQLVANIIDFRDPTDVPTLLTKDSLNETAATMPNPVYGAKGLHVTQVMPSPDPIYSALLNGGEMTDNGSGNPTETPPHDWVWDPAGFWYVLDFTHGGPNPPGTPQATFTFGNLMPGYYAMRLIGSNSPFTLTYLGTPYTVTPSIPAPEGGTWNTGFVRKPSNRLVCFQVAAPGDTLTFQLQAPMGAQFRGFALCAQYIQLTNISTHDIRLDGLTVMTDQGLLLGPTQPWLPNYTRADGGLVDLRRIPGAAVGTPGFLTDSAPTPSTATFPINYGTYVICMSEESYEKQWSAQHGDPDYSANPGFNGALSTNGDGIWGDERNEAYPIYPFGDFNTDAQTMALLMGAKGTGTQYAPWVTVKDAAGRA